MTLQVPSVSVSPTLKLSQFIFGTWRIADIPNCTPESLLTLVKYCINVGITSFDCADIYGGVNHVCEKKLGEALALDPSLRSQMQIISKCGIVCDSKETGTLVKHYNLSYEYIVQRAQESLHALGIETLDLLLIHRPSPMMDADQVAKAFNFLKESGKVNHFGVSNFLPFQLRLLQSRLDYPLVTNQVELNPLYMDCMHDGTLDQAQELCMKPMIWSPLAGGRLFKETADNKTLRVQSVLKKMAMEMGSHVSMDQIVFSWIRMHPSQPLIVLGTSKTERIDAAVESLSLNLTLEQWFHIWEASNGACVA